MADTLAFAPEMVVVVELAAAAMATRAVRRASVAVVAVDPWAASRNFASMSEAAAVCDICHRS